MSGNKTKGILFVLSAAFFFSLMSLAVRMAGDVPTMQKVLFRNSVAALVAFSMLMKNRDNFVLPGKSDMLPLFLRCACGMFGIFCNFYAIDHINIADANILNKLSPFFAIVMSIFILKEKPNRKQVIAVLIAFTGALFVVKPSFSAEFFYAAVGAMGGFMAGTAYTFVRKLGMNGVKGPVIVFAFSTFSTIMSVPFVIANHAAMSTSSWLWLLTAGIAAAGGQFSITAAYTHAPAKEISVFDYTQVVIAAALGFLFLGQIPDAYSIIGYILIIGVAVWRWAVDR